jgi:hypothetical protein
MRAAVSGIAKVNCKNRTLLKPLKYTSCARPAAGCSLSSIGCIASLGCGLVELFQCPAGTCIVIHQASMNDLLNMYADVPDASSHISVWDMFAVVVVIVFMPSPWLGSFGEFVRTTHRLFCGL